MHDKFTMLTSDLYAYLLAHCTPIDPLLGELACETEEATGAASLMQIAREQGELLSMLVRIGGVRRAVEIGTFTGYSSLCIASAMARDGQLLCCDVSDEWTATARRYWRRAGVADRITLRLGPAIETLRALPRDTRFDFAFIDADKESYVEYYEQILARMDSGGVIVFDNVLWMGSVIDDNVTDSETRGIRRLNDLLAGDSRVDAVMLAVGDGITIVRKH
jgi:caffeoyl-CoA O-methyltransferase